MGSVVGSALLRQIDGFVECMTTGVPEDKKKRVSGSIEHTSAFVLYDKLNRPGDGDGKDDTFSIMASSVRDAVMKYTISGRSQLLTKNESMLIEFGLCAVTASQTDEDQVVTFGEPLIVEAGFNRLSSGWFDKLLRSSSENASMSGFQFEKWVLPQIKGGFVDYVKSLKENDIKIPQELDQDWTFGLTAYGVVVRKCTTPKETMEWIDQSLKSHISGSIPPFCFPDETMGPDLLALLHKTDNWKTTTMCLWQMKMRKQANQAEALRVVMPEFLFMENRDRNPVWALENDEEKSKWEELYKKLYGEERTKKRKRGGFSVLVQYPAKVTRTSKTGAIPLGSCCVGNKKVPFSRPKTYNSQTSADLLVTLDKTEAV
ncbi:MAG: hypothetical protein MI754_18380, partial [Chromatiales bacterium]|nr:hypothetical protein [Chromatiales bacterium]